MAFEQANQSVGSDSACTAGRPYSRKLGQPPAAARFTPARRHLAFTMPERTAKQIRNAVRKKHLLRIPPTGFRESVRRQENHRQYL